MVLKLIAGKLVQQAEKRLGIALDYTHEIAQTDFDLHWRNNHIFKFLDPNKNKKAPPLACHTARVADAVTLHRKDAPKAREDLRAAYGKTGLIELSYAKNGAALLPGIKRAMGYATTCDINLLRRTSA